MLIPSAQVSESIKKLSDKLTVIPRVVHDSSKVIEEWLVQHSGISETELKKITYRYYNEEAAKHLTRVASGLDSQVLGEPQIMGQVRDSFHKAKLNGTVGEELDMFFRVCLKTAKNIRTKTEIGHNPVSVAYAAVFLAGKIYEDLESKKALLIGAGETISLVAQHLKSAGIEDITIANRTLENAVSLAKRYQANPIALSSLSENLPEIDIIISSTGAPNAIIKKEHIEIAMRSRKRSPMFLVDIAVPRDIEQSVEDISNVYLYTIDQLTEVINSNLDKRQKAAQAAEEFVLSGAKIYLKREDLAHTGAHKINNALGQGLLAKRMGKNRIIAETGAGQHGVATATVCAKLGLECIVYMGEEDIKRQALNVFRMKLLGAEVRPVNSGSKTLKDAINEAIRDWVTNVDTTHYLIGSVVGPHPYPMIVRDYQKIIGEESKQQIINETGKLPDYVVACVGGGSNAMGIFYDFINDDQVKLIGVEAGGDGVETGKHSSTITAGSIGVLHGSMSYLIQDENGQVIETHSISAGLDYPGVGPEHSWLNDSGRAEYVSVNDDEALEGFKLLCETEGIIPALEPAHAIYYLSKLAPRLDKDKVIILGLSGRGDKDMETVAGALNVGL